MCIHNGYDRAKTPLFQSGDSALLRSHGICIALFTAETLLRRNGVCTDANGHQRGLLLELKVVGERSLVRGHGHTRHHFDTTAHGQAVVVHGLL